MTRAVLMETGDTKVDTWRYTEIQRPLSAALLPSSRMRQALCAMKLDEVWASLRSRNFHPGAVMGNRDEIYRPELQEKFPNYEGADARCQRMSKVRRGGDMRLKIIVKLLPCLLSLFAFPFYFLLSYPDQLTL